MIRIDYWKQNKRASEKSAYSQEYVASVLGVTRQAVSKWETDQTSPDTNNLIALAQLFNVSVEYLAVGKEADVELPVMDKTPNYGTRKIIGYILLGVGLLTAVLGLIMFYELLLLAAAFIVVGVLCIAVKKHFGLVTAWVVIPIITISAPYLTGAGYFLYQMGLVALVVLTVITIISVKRKTSQK